MQGNRCAVQIRVCGIGEPGFSFDRVGVRPHESCIEELSVTVLVARSPMANFLLGAQGQQR